MRTLQKLSIVAPAYNEEAALPAFYNAVKNALQKLGAEYEFLFVDDGSTDRTFDMLRDIAAADTRVKVLSFSRNFGHPAAISAGLSHAKGDAVVVMDADLQDPPEVLEKFIAAWKNGADVVYGVRENRKEWFGLRFCYWLFYRLLQRLSPIRMPLDSGDFSLLDRRVVDILNALPERRRFVRGLRAWAGFTQVGVPFERNARLAGTSKYTFRRLLKLAMDGILSFSYVPLRVATILGFIIAFLSFAAIIIVAYFRLVHAIVLTGFSSTIITILFLGGVQLFSIGILGEYVGRIYAEVKQRPLYVVKEKIGFDDKELHSDHG